jgi:hypothetical protein
MDNNTPMTTDEREACQRLTDHMAELLEAIERLEHETLYRLCRRVRDNRLFFKSVIRDVMPED